MTTFTITPLPPIMTIKAAAELAGVCTRTIRRWHAEGRIRVGRTAASGSGRCTVLTVDLLRALGHEPVDPAPTRTR